VVLVVNKKKNKKIKKKLRKFGGSPATCTKETRQ